MYCSYLYPWISALGVRRFGNASLVYNQHHPSRSSKIHYSPPFPSRLSNPETKMAARVHQLTAHLNQSTTGLLANKTAIVTGGGQGIGAETCRLFAKEGAKVVVADIDATKANATAQSINETHPGRAIAVVGDILDDNYIKEVVKKAAEFGRGKVHILVNNAGFTWDAVIHKVSIHFLFGTYSVVAVVGVPSGGRR